MLCRAAGMPLRAAETLRRAIKIFREMTEKQSNRASSRSGEAKDDFPRGRPLVRQTEHEKVFTVPHGKMADENAFFRL